MRGHLSQACIEQCDTVRRLPTYRDEGRPRVRVATDGLTAYPRCVTRAASSKRLMSRHVLDVHAEGHRELSKLLHELGGRRLIARGHELPLLR